MEHKYAWVPAKHAALFAVGELRCPESLWICGWEIREMYQSSHPDSLPNRAVG